MSKPHEFSHSHKPATDRGTSGLRRFLNGGVWFSLAPKPDQPLPLWMIFPVIFAALYITHWSLLRLPYYWDEAGYYIPAAWDFFRTGSLIPITTVTNAHPPLPSIYLALWWKISGYHPAVTREAILIVAAIGLLAVWRLAIRLNGNALVAFWTVVLTAIYPIWFAQSTLAHADIFAAAATLWALVYALPDRISETENRKPALKAGAIRMLWPAAIWFSIAVLAKETAVVTPVALAAFELGMAFRKTRAVRKQSYAAAAWYLLCILPLACWYAYHYAKTGFLFGNPEFLRYNATSTLDPGRIAAAFLHRLLHLFAHMNMFVPVLCTIAAMMLDPVLNEAGRTRTRISFTAQARVYALLLANALAFSVLGGALLTRYLLPMFPLILLIAVSTFHRRTRYWQLLAAFSAAGFVVALFVNPPYGFAPEDNLSYAHVIRLHQSVVKQLATRYAGATVLTAWPMSDEIARPELGYVTTPFDVARIEDFTAAQVAKAGEDPGAYSAAIAFSTKEDPPSLPFHLNAPAVEAEYFGLHHDLSAEAIAARLGGDLVWQRRDDLEWVALIRFQRRVEARLR